MTVKTFSIDFNNRDYAVIEQALMIDEDCFNNVIENFIVETAHQIIFSFIENNIENSKKQVRRRRRRRLHRSSELGVKPNDSQLVEEQNNEDFFKFADKEWKINAINAVLEASRNNKTITPEEIFGIIGVTPLKRKSFRRKLGCLMKESGIKCVKKNRNGTTVTGYYI